MRRRRAVLAGLAAVVLLGGCTGEAKEGTAAPGAREAARAALLTSCPAKVTPRAFDDKPPPRPLGAPNQVQVEKAAIIGQWFLDRLPRDRSGMLSMSADRLGIVVQVTRDVEATRAALQALMEPGVVVYVEQVRYSYNALTRLNTRLMGLRGLEWNSIGVGFDNRVEVAVTKDVEGARRLIGAVADPCAFRVEQRDLAG